LPTGLIFDIKRYSIHDGPGIRTTLFFKGCPLRCAWCHNPESQAAAEEMMFRSRRCQRCGACVEACPEGAIGWSEDGPLTDWSRCVRCGACALECYAEARERIGRTLTVAEAMAEIERDVAFYDQSGGGVTFSGGEPLQQPEFLGALLRACQEREIHTAVDTSGFAPWETLEGLRADVDLFLYDLKIMDEARHRQFTGASNALILENLRRLSAMRHALLIRIPVIPGVNADFESVRELGAFIAGLPQVSGVELLPYHRIALDKYERLNLPYGLPEVQPPSEVQMREIAQQLAQWGLAVRQGG
jgi:pyruvate formate lyase activating enzyme